MIRSSWFWICHYTSLKFDFDWPPHIFFNVYVQRLWGSSKTLDVVFSFPLLSGKRRIHEQVCYPETNSCHLENGKQSLAINVWPKYWYTLLINVASLNVPTPSWIIHLAPKHCQKLYIFVHAWQNILITRLRAVFIRWTRFYFDRWQSVFHHCMQMTFFQLLFTIQFNLLLHLFTQWIRFSEWMVKVFHVFLRVKLENLKRRKDIRLKKKFHLRCF
jgi:hypothetical protein